VDRGFKLTPPGTAKHKKEINIIKPGDKDRLEKELKRIVDLHSRGQLIRPIDAYRKLYESGLTSHILYINLALLELSDGNLAEAFSILEKSIAFEPNSAITYILLGTISRRLSDPCLAIKYLKKSLDLTPNNFEALVAVSLAYFDCNLHSEALQACHRAYLINPKSSELLANMSMIYLALDRAEDAKKSAEESIRLNPQLPEAYLNLGNALYALNDWSEAIESHLQALKIRPVFSQALSGIGNAYRALGKLNLAQKYFEEAIDSNPNDFQAYSNLAILKRDLGDLDSALCYCLKAVEINKKSADVFINLGVIYYDLGDLHSSESAYQRAIEIDPGNAEAQFSLATVLLTQGDYSKGLCYYEWRFAHNKKDPILQEIHGLSRWQGPDSSHFLPEIYLLHEQGLGDSFQFIRFAPFLREYADKVYFVGPTSILDLFVISNIIDGVIATSSDSFGCCKEAASLPLMSIPHKLGLEPSTFSCNIPYLNGDSSRKKFWQQKILREKEITNFSFLVALNWQGNPDVEREKMRGRSIPLQMLSPLASVRGVRFVSIQKGYGSEQLEDCSFRDKFVSFQEEVEKIWDFADIASLIQCCDLVISSDTSAAHLAGAIGARLWIPLKKVAEWRWGVHSSTTPWYPTATLFRQTTNGDWTGPVDSMRRALEQGIL